MTVGALVLKMQGIQTEQHRLHPSPSQKNITHVTVRVFGFGFSVNKAKSQLRFNVMCIDVKSPASHTHPVSFSLPLPNKEQKTY